MQVKPHENRFVIETTIAGLFKAEQEARVRDYRSIDMHRESKCDCVIQEDETEICIVAVLTYSSDDQPAFFTAYTSYYISELEAFELWPNLVGEYGDEITNEMLARKLFPNLSEFTYRP